MHVHESTQLAAERSWIACPVCTGQECVPYLEARGYSIVQCANCGLRYVNPQPSAQELQQIYASFDQGSQWRSGEEHFNRGVRKAILHFKQSGSLLDIGSGSGNFLRCMREAGFSVFGVEPSESGSAYAHSAHSIECFNGTVEGFLASGPERQFDVITILNVLEHLKDPASVLLRLGSLLRSDGVLAVVVPDARFHAVVGQVRRRLGFTDPFWLATERHPLVGFDPPHHLCSFEPRTILQLLARCGFEQPYMQNAPVIFNEDRWKNYAKVVVRAFSAALYRLSFGGIVFGYSTLVIVRPKQS